MPGKSCCWSAGSGLRLALPNPTPVAKSDRMRTGQTKRLADQNADVKKGGLWRRVFLFHVSEICLSFLSKREKRPELQKKFSGEKKIPDGNLAITRRGGYVHMNVRREIPAATWEQIKTAHASGIGLREIARNMGIPEGTVLARITARSGSRCYWSRFPQDYVRSRRRAHRCHPLWSVESYMRH